MLRHRFVLLVLFVLCCCLFESWILKNVKLSRVRLFSNAIDSIPLDRLRLEAMSCFVQKPKDLQFSLTSGGVNNHMFYVTCPGDNVPSYVLRIYNNGLNTRRVDFEHQIIKLLQPHVSECSFAIPVAVESLNGRETYVTLSTGAAATLFRFIPGVLPKRQFVRAIGRAAGQLSVYVTILICVARSFSSSASSAFSHLLFRRALQAVTAVAPPGMLVEGSAPNPPYSDLFRAHHALTRDIFFEQIVRLHPCFPRRSQPCF